VKNLLTNSSKCINEKHHKHSVSGTYIEEWAIFFPLNLEVPCKVEYLPGILHSARILMMCVRLVVLCFYEGWKSDKS
jgi:hypothetical protein